MKQKMAEALERGDHDFSHFGTEANLFAELESLFRSYGRAAADGDAGICTTSRRQRLYGQKPGTFTAWEDLTDETDLLFYEGLHGAVVTGERGHCPTCRPADRRRARSSISNGSRSCTATRRPGVIPPKR